jgi:hypothetical protein
MLPECSCSPKKAVTAITLLPIAHGCDGMRIGFLQYEPLGAIPTVPGASPARLLANKIRCS